MGVKKHGDEETLVYGFDWATEYLDEGDSISTSTWRVPAELTSVSEQTNGSITTIKLDVAGTAEVGETYEVVNIVTTAISGETFERSG